MDSVVRSGSTVGTRSIPCTQLDYQSVLGVLKVIMMEGFVGHIVIIRLSNVTNMVDLVAGKILRQTCPQILLYTLVQHLIRLWEF